MHDLDRTMMEFEREADSYETDDFEFADELESEAAEAMDLESPFDELDEMDLAAELLSIQSEEELDQFLGKVFKRVWRGVRKVGSTVGRIARPLGGILKGIAKKALPVVGGALGSLIPVPGVGTAVGTALGGALGKALEKEFEGLSPEDREFEIARRFVQVAGAAARNAAAAQPGADPAEAARQAVTAAAKRYVSGMTGAMDGSVPQQGASAGRSGRWIRRGRRIILLGV
jgi:hypothetical protein